MPRLHASEGGQRLKRIVISGAYGYGNIGDEAILRGMLLTLRGAVPDASFVVLSGNPERTNRLHGVKATSRLLFLPSLRQMVAFGLSRAGHAQIREWIHQVRRADAYVVGGGGLLYDRVNTAKARWLERLYLFGWPISHWATEIRLVQALGKPVVLYAVGVGPVTTRLGRLLLRKIAGRVDMFTVRDELSRATLAQCGAPTHRVEVTADPAILLSPVPSDEVSPVLAGAGVSGRDRPRIGFAPRNWYPYAVSDKVAAARRQERWESEMAEAADRLIELLDAELVFMPMQDYPEPFDDAACADRIASRMKHRERTRQVSPGLDPQVVMGVLGTMDLVVAMRLHALILASAALTPVVGIVYDPKVRGFLESIGQPDAGLEMDRVSPDALVDVVSSVWARRQRVREQMAASVEHLRGLARRNAELVASLLAEPVG